MTFTIGRLALETGCKIPTIRYFEKIGLLPPPERSPGNTRIYGRAHVARLAFIRHSRELGFSQAAIRQLLELTDKPGQSCDSVTQIAQFHLAEVKDRIARLVGLQAELERMIAACDGGQVESCQIIETLADHAHDHCLVRDHAGARLV